MRQIFFDIAVFFLFILPPLLFPSGDGRLDFSTARVLLYSVLHALSTVIIVKINNNLDKSNYNTARPLGQVRDAIKDNALFFHMKIGVTLVTLGGVVLTQVFLQAASIIFRLEKNGGRVFLVRPGGLGWGVAVLTLFFSALGEEMLYRVYLPQKIIRLARAALKNFDSKKKDERKNKKIGLLHKRFVIIFSLFFSALLFALPHRYMGGVAVLNAFIAHILLYWCYKKTKCAAYGCMAHFLYNLLSFFADSALTPHG